jgi:short-subunit dehydrogenase
MKPLQFEGKWIMVTGASSGLGKEMATQLASNYKANLILVARRKEALEALKSRLQQAYSVQVDILVADLGEESGVLRVADTVIQRGDLYGAILNAGITYFGPHVELSDEEFRRLIQVNLIGVSLLTSHLVKYFEPSGKEAGIMLVSSMAGFMPTPYQSVYSGTKAYLIQFANALQLELKNKALSLTVFEPGGIATEMTSGENFSTLRSWLMPVDQVAKIALRAFRLRKYNAIPGFINQVGYVLSRIMPRKFMVGQLAKTYGKALSRRTVHAAGTSHRSG